MYRNELSVSLTLLTIYTSRKMPVLRVAQDVWWGLTAERDTVQERAISAPSRSLHLILCLAVAQAISNRSVIARCRLDIGPVCARLLVNRMALGGASCSVLLT